MIVSATGNGMVINPYMGSLNIFRLEAVDFTSLFFVKLVLFLTKGKLHKFKNYG